MFFTGILQFLDKTALNYANLFGIRTHVHLTGSQFNWLASLFYFGYLIGQLPTPYLLTKYPTGKVLGICTIFWGIMVLVFSWSTNFAGAATCRFFLGVFEAPITPGLTLAVGYWWTRSEAALRYNIIYSSLGWAGILGSLISVGISGDSDDGPVKRWQLIFVVVSQSLIYIVVNISSQVAQLGSVTILWGVIVFAFLPDSPVSARFFNQEERLAATARVAANQVGYVRRIINRHYKMGLINRKDKIRKSQAVSNKERFMGFQDMVYCA